MEQKKISAIIIAFFAVFVLYSESKSLGAVSSTASLAPNSRDELQAKIQDKTQELQSINAQLQEAQKSLSQTQSQRQTLQRQLNIYQNTIAQLNLNVKEDTVSIQKLNFEIDSLNYDLKDIQESVADKRSAVNQLLVSIQKADTESGNLLQTFLKSKTLADGIMEAQSLSDMHGQLEIDIENLAALSEKYQKTIKEKNGKVSEVQVRKDNASARMAIVSNQKEEQQTILAQTKNQESLYQKQLAEIQKLQDQVEAEIELMGQELRQNIDPKLLPAIGQNVFINPVPRGTLSQGYGGTSFAQKTYRGKWHNGIDFAAPVGTEVYAAADGTVINVGNQDKYCPRAAYGKFVVIKHNNGLTTLYGHLSLYKVSIGQTVTRGQLIAYVGKTGWATGPHVHFTVFASQTLTPARPGFPEGAKASISCGPMPVGGDLNPLLYLSVKK